MIEKSSWKCPICGRNIDVVCWVCPNCGYEYQEDNLLCKNLLENKIDDD